MDGCGKVEFYYMATLVFSSSLHFLLTCAVFYSPIFHWMIGLLVVALFALAKFFNQQPISPTHVYTSISFY